MNYKLLSILNAIVVAAFGALFLVVPEAGLNLFGSETYTATIFVARFMGSVMVLAGMFIWVAKDLAETGVARTMTIMLLTSSVTGFILTLVGMVGTGVIRQNGWVLLVIHIIFALGYGYLVSGVTITASKKQS